MRKSIRKNDIVFPIAGASHQEHPSLAVQMGVKDRFKSRDADVMLWMLIIFWCSSYSSCMVGHTPFSLPFIIYNGFNPFICHLNTSLPVFPKKRFETSRLIPCVIPVAIAAPKTPIVFISI